MTLGANITHTPVKVCLSASLSCFASPCWQSIVGTILQGSIMKHKALDSMVEMVQIAIVIAWIVTSWKESSPARRKVVREKVSANIYDYARNAPNDGTSGQTMIYKNSQLTLD